MTCCIDLPKEGTNFEHEVLSTFYLAAQHVRGTEVVLATAVPMRYRRKIYVPLSVQVYPPPLHPARNLADAKITLVTPSIAGYSPRSPTAPLPTVPCNENSCEL